MFITNHYVAFSGWPDTRVMVHLKDIKSIEKSNSLFFIPNALTIVLTDGEEYFFGSFLDRDLCHRTISSMVTIQKSLVELTRPESAVSAAVTDGAPTDTSTNSDVKVSSEVPIKVIDLQPELETAALPDYKALFKKHSDIMVILEEEVDVSAKDIWKCMWQKSTGYR
jgi:hypothetical protein